VAGYGFPGRYKLIKTDEFSSVFSFRRRVFGEYLTMHDLPNKLGHPRLGIVVGKKTARHAVARNYIRRVLREWFRRDRDRLGAFDLVIRVSKPFGRSDFRKVAEQLEELLGKLQRASIKMSAGKNGTRTDLAG
jgi:ribonuclease P protein component